MQDCAYINFKTLNMIYFYNVIYEIMFLTIVRRFIACYLFYVYIFTNKCYLLI